MHPLRNPTLLEAGWELLGELQPPYTRQPTERGYVLPNSIYYEIESA